MAPANPSRLPQVLLLAAVGLALMAASAAADDAVAASTAGQDPWRKGETWPTFKGPRGKDKRPIFSSFKVRSRLEGLGATRPCPSCRCPPANPSQFLRERLLESPRLRHRPPRDPFTTSGGYCTWRVGQIK